MAFRTDFLWGAASSAYQTEGFATADGGGKSIWDTFCEQPNKIIDHSSGAIATDSYHRYQEDILLLKKLGISAYRFSISWARVDPTGTGAWNEAGFAFYHKLVDCCLQHNITPFITLYHWELPQALEDLGGWRNRNTAYAFAQYAAEVARQFAGSVSTFITLNEPQCTVFLGHGNGAHAPGLQADLSTQFMVLHHQLLAHGLAVQRIRAIAPDASVGIASTGRLCYPKTNTEADINAATTATFQSLDTDWGFTHQMLLDPICLGHYPTDAEPKLTEAFSHIAPEDLQIIASPIDFIGLNIYNGNEVFAQVDGTPVYAQKPTGYPITAIGWPVTPKVMEWGVRAIYKRYHLPLYVTENGMSCHDWVSLDGAVHDANRIDFLTRYLVALHNATQSGIDVRGYFHWSITDNFEWNNGYCQRFGLIYIDYNTYERIPKDSAYWYQTIVQTNGEALWNHKLPDDNV